MGTKIGERDGSGVAALFAIPGKKPGTLPTENSEEPKMRALKKWSAWIGVTICITYILMYFLEAYFESALFIVLFILLLCILPIIILFITAKSKKNQLVIFILQLFSAGLIIFSFIFGFLFITIRYYPLLGSKFAKGMTKEKILSLKLGMSKDDIVAIIGNPIEIVENKNENKCRLVYATPGIYGMGFEFRLILINNNLDYIYIERNDFGVYFCDKKKCPEIFNPKALDELISYSLK